MAEKSKLLIIGATGYLGKYIVQAGINAGHPTFALVRERTISNPEKAELIGSFTNTGVGLLYGDIQDHESLIKAIKQVDVVISVVGLEQVADQIKIISAIKEAGNIKRFLPSEFGQDVDNQHVVEPAATQLQKKVKIRRAIEAEGIPYTYIISNVFAGYVPSLFQLKATAPPRDKVVILSDGTVKGVYVKEEDIAAYTIKAVDDPRTLNKSLHIIPPLNLLSFIEIISLWEKKIGKTLEKNYLSEDQVLQKIRESSSPLDFLWAFRHHLLITGNANNFKIEAPLSVEATKLYPEVQYTTIDEYLDRFVGGAT